jgi:selenide,water dikinase
MGPAALAQVLEPLKGFWRDHNDPNLLVGLDIADDAAVYRISDTQAIIQTVDFFTPIVDDPRMYGAIAAANAVSDIYAMGGEVLLALNIGGFPGDLPPAMISEIFLGAAEIVRQAGGIIVGGHTVTDNEPKFGLVVTGTIHPDHILTLAGAQLGDVLILTKPLGNGIIATAARADSLTDPAHLDNAVRWMTALNRGAARALRRVGANACTDVTGFGLLGHAGEMAEGSHVNLRISASALPLLDGALEYAQKGYTTGGAARNAQFFAKVEVRGREERGENDNDKPSFVSSPVPLGRGTTQDTESGRATPIDENLVKVAWDPQTSGGLLIAVAAEKHTELLKALSEEGVKGYIIGEVVSAGDGRVLLEP